MPGGGRNTIMDALAAAGRGQGVGQGPLYEGRDSHSHNHSQSVGSSRGNVRGASSSTQGNKNDTLLFFFIRSHLLSSLLFFQFTYLIFLYIFCYLSFSYLISCLISFFNVISFSLFHHILFYSIFLSALLYSSFCIGPSLLFSFFGLSQFIFSLHCTTCTSYSFLIYFHIFILLISLLFLSSPFPLILFIDILGLPSELPVVVELLQTHLRNLLTERLAVTEEAAVLSLSPSNSANGTRVGTATPGIIPVNDLAFNPMETTSEPEISLEINSDVNSHGDNNVILDNDDNINVTYHNVQSALNRIREETNGTAVSNLIHLENVDQSNISQSESTATILNNSTSNLNPSQESESASPTFDCIVPVPTDRSAFPILPSHLFGFLRTGTGTGTGTGMGSDYPQSIQAPTATAATISTPTSVSTSSTTRASALVPITVSDVIPNTNSSNSVATAILSSVPSGSVLSGSVSDSSTLVALDQLARCFQLLQGIEDVTVEAISG